MSAPRRPGGQLPRHLRGVTLIELVTVLTVVSVIATVGARLMAGPIVTAIGAGNAIALADAVSQATRRLDEDLRGALPNSVRIVAGPAGRMVLEFVPLQAAGRYRMRAAAVGTPGDPLDHDDPADDRFDLLGPMPAVPAGAQLVIHNLGSADADVYTGNNRRSGVVRAGGQIVFSPAGAFPVASPAGRFALVTSAVSWVCSPAADGSGTLTRIDGYAIGALVELPLADICAVASDQVRHGQ